MSVTLIAANPFTVDGLRTVTELPLTLGLYPDGTPVIDLEDAWNKAEGLFKAVVIKAKSIQDLTTGLMVVDSIRERGGSVDSLIIPHIPGGRQDRLKWEGDWLFTLKYVAKLINSMNFKRVVTIDPHSIATTALIDRLYVPELRLEYMMRFQSNKPKYDGVIAPDAGAAKRAEAVAKEFGIPAIQAFKTRDPATNKLSGFHINSDDGNLLRGKHMLVADDLCDAGGTFLGLFEEINAWGATADLFVTHGLFTKGTKALAKAYKNLYTTDSTDYRHDDVTYLEVTRGLTAYA